MKTEVFNLSGLNGSNGFVLNGIDKFDSSGRSVIFAGDVNTDTSAPARAKRRRGSGRIEDDRNPGVCSRS